MNTPLSTSATRRLALNNRSDEGWRVGGWEEGEGGEGGSKGME